MHANEGLRFTAVGHESWRPSVSGLLASWIALWTITKRKLLAGRDKAISDTPSYTESTTDWSKPWTIKHFSNTNWSF